MCAYTLKIDNTGRASSPLRCPRGYRGVREQACSVSFLEEFFSETGLRVWGILGNSARIKGPRSNSLSPRLELFLRCFRAGGNGLQFFHFGPPPARETQPPPSN